MSDPHVLIIGGGFGGLSAARALASSPVRVTLLDRQNHHLFQPLLYQVATAGLNPGDISAPIRHLLREQENVTVLLAEATHIDPAAKTVHLTEGSVAYDHLIVATGATHAYFGHDEWAARAPGLKSLEDAVEIRQRFLLAFEAAEREHDPERRRAWLTFVVVGAGPTGVELAGAMSEVAREALREDFRAINPADARVLLVEGLDRVLPTYPKDLSAQALKALHERGVEVRLNTRVTRIDDDAVMMGDELVAARTVVWAAGVAASPLAKSLGVPLDRAGRVKVDPALRVPGHPDIFVLGDLATIDQDGAPVPGVAQAALQGGEQTALNVMRSIRGQELEPFHYTDLGSMATIGRNDAVAVIGKAQFTGFFAWLMWLFVHVMALVGFRNRLAVIFSWAWSYVTFNRGSRLITRKVPPTLLAYDYDYDDAPAAGARQTTGDGSTAPTSKPPAEARSVP
jgi:NADH dehydrogenase